MTTINVPNKINENYIEHYKMFCNNISPSIRQELGLLKDDEITVKSNWIPPTTFGLTNSQRIIPAHYFTKEFKEIDMFYEISKDIRNLHPLKQEQLNYIKMLPKEKIIELIELYNHCFICVEKLFLDDEVEEMKK